MTINAGPACGRQLLDPDAPYQSGRIGTIHWRAAPYDRTSMTTLCAVGSEAKVSNALP